MASPGRAVGQLGSRALRRRRAEIRPDLSRRSAAGSAASGWRMGRCGSSVRSDLWAPYDRTTCVIGPQGSGKTLDLLAPALLDAPGAALVTLTKPEDLFLTLGSRGDGGRPVVVLDPFGAAGGVPPLTWDPIDGCADARVAERRAKAFSAGGESAHRASGDDASRFYAGECAKVLQAYFHAAALAGATLDDVLRWVADPQSYRDAEEILRTHPEAELFWDGLLRGALRGDERTASNTVTTVQQAMGLFFQSSIRRRCVPGPGRPATDLRAVLRAGGTIYLLGRDDPYSSAAPLMTAVAEHVLDLAKQLGERSPQGRLCPPFLACLDELPSTAPIPTLLTRMANERALGLCFIVAAQTWRQLVMSFGEEGARTLLGLSNNLVAFGGGKDSRFYQELSDLIGQRWHSEVRYSARGGWWNPASERSWAKVRRPVLEAAEIRRIPTRRALLLAESGDPIILRFRRCIDGRRGRELRARQAETRATLRQGSAS
ncbi:TraM recognition domain-containing protein [Nocardioides sp. zg-578]|uniref:TraM recognition domain-containing protein n=2 Tax=Nocardioides marmotae TaxID=2663857 RepID=A0A6I3J9Q0_9ACTN|nr:TraM recognition domain-containing protein [Nocardioides marmotae]MCR6030693.1 TraM recognition domain-containing protein [Gordonia jinghuaiqii]MTB86636.1 TraM recognition domain-containing protein [Nocardioides marmotae]MTB94328.1 TraM recognition domain-containing protein [Nocardioides marmotae]QKE03507.1 TraM recognition domain-containing protein [Nocardioides marmotae]